VRANIIAAPQHPELSPKIRKLITKKSVAQYSYDRYEGENL